MACFNMTPMIDVVFLLIVFFMLICQFISQDNQRLSVPDNCSTAIEEQINAENEIVIQVWAGDEIGDNIIYSIGQDDIEYASGSNDTSSLISHLSERLKIVAQGIDNPVIRLRGDGKLSCLQVRPAIKAAAGAGLANIRFSAFKDSGPNINN